MNSRERGRCEVRVSTTRDQELIDITTRVEGAVEQLGVSRGTVVVFSPHTTAGVTINESADPDVRRDIVTTLDKIVPPKGDYHHQEGNSPAHIKAGMTGSSVMVRIEDGKPCLGTWQGIYFAEFDGPRERCIWVWKL